MLCWPGLRFPAIRSQVGRAEARLPHLRVHTFDTIEELRRGLQDFVAHYNATWLVARHGYRTPNQVRAERHGLAPCPPANLPLAA